MTKICYKCKEYKQKREFNRNKSKHDGLQNYCRECDNRRNRAYRVSEEGREKYRKKDRRQAQKHPNRLKARKATWYATFIGKLPKATTLDCMKCGNKAEEYHHESYDKKDWLNVIPYCRECHLERHKEMEKGVTQ